MPLRFLAVASIALVVCASAACGGFFGKQYEYEEDLYLSLDGSADIIINTSLAALKALRGIEVDARLRREDRAALRAHYESPVSSVKRIRRPWTRKGRRFVQIRIEVSDLRKLPKEGPLSWSRYELFDEGGRYVFRQNVGGSALRPGTLENVGWDGSEIVAFRLHLPSRIQWHNARNIHSNETTDVQRGNILAWEQHLSDRLAGQPVAIEVRMDRESILHRTLWLFAGAFGAAVLVLVGAVWLTLRKGAKEAATTTPGGSELSTPLHRP
jgi:hypothetical protein